MRYNNIVRGFVIKGGFPTWKVAKLYHLANDQWTPGAHPDLRGDLRHITGDCTLVRGDPSGLSGDISGLRGDVSALHGDPSGLQGEISAAAGNVALASLDPFSPLPNPFVTAKARKHPLFHRDSRGKQVNGPHVKIRGEAPDLNGDCTNIYGDITGLTGFLSVRLIGDVSRITGRITGIEGNAGNMQGNITRPETPPDDDTPIHWSKVVLPDWKRYGK